MNNLPNKEEYVKNFRKMWKELAILTLKNKCKISKEEYLYELSSDPLSKECRLQSNCYLCEYAFRISCFLKEHSQQYCIYCPMTLNRYSVGCLGGVYDDYITSKYDGDYKKAAYLAYKISKLPVVN